MINTSYSSKKEYIFLLLITLFLLGSNGLNAQIYSHNFGTTTISSHPYTVAPNILANHLSGSSWSNSVNSWTSTTGSSGEAIRLTTAAPATITLSFNVDANYQVEITSFNFWRQRSNFGVQNWSMTINGITAGNGTIGATGDFIGITNVANPIAGLSGTVTVVISLSNATGNGTFRLDDFTLNGSVTSSCASPTITSFSPVSGPENTLVTITGNGFLVGTGTSSVKFNGVEATSFTVVSNTEIKAYVPSGNNGTGAITLITNGCDGSSTINFTEIITVSPTNYSNDIYISELYDATPGDGGIIELYNGTSSPINLAGYTLKRYGDVGGSTFYTVVLSGIVPVGGIYLIGIGTGTTPCGITDNVHFSTGFNDNDEFELLKNGTVIDNVHTPSNVGYTMIRNPNAVAPKVNYSSPDWQTSLTQNCADIGNHTVTVNVPPVIGNPVSKVGCENSTIVFTAPLVNPTGFTYQWKTLNSSGVWINVPNTSPYSGVATNTLTITPTPLTFDKNQYYCQATSTNYSIVSNTAQLNVTTANIVPTFTQVASICQGETLSALPTTSNNGITGTWSPALDNSATTIYTFTPNAGQCATTATMTITVNTSTVPAFTAVSPICQGENLSALPTTSNNGVIGTWSPALDNNATTTYTFNPNAGQCATTATMIITVNTSVVPTFNQVAPICQGETLSALPTTSNNGITGSWSPALDNSATTIYTFTPNAGQCATTATMTITVNTSTVPAFTAVSPICQGETLPALPTTSNNGITGTWSPALDNNATTIYTFTPNAGQCATTATMTITVNTSTVPAFTAVSPICQGETLPALPTTSNNGITGTWSPALDNNATTTYTFNPNAGQCATTATMTITVNTSTVPAFTAVSPICQGETLPALPTTSNNGITGTWSPALDNTATTTYTFTPSAGQCSTTTTMTITVNTATVPTFTAVSQICQGETLSALPTTSNNGVIGTWSPALDNTATTTYTFTPSAGQCSTTTTMTITVNTATVPTFTAVSQICQGETLSALPTTSNNGVIGTWSPALDNSATTTYTFTPSTGQCATTATMTITVNTSVVPTFNQVAPICQGETLSALPTTSNNGITGTWSPALDNSATTTYTFTPSTGQCATTATMTITVNTSVVPTFNQMAPICQGETLSALPTTSNNGITGTWSPALDNSATTTYTFTPSTGQCATTATMIITVNIPTVPTFTTVSPICQGETLSALPTSSNNGITGTWSPALDNSATTTYTFTPNAGQCATTATMIITVNIPTVPTFTTVSPICQGETLSALPTSSNNGITGTWSPALDNSATTTYTFTPNAGQCATTATMIITVNIPTVPTFTTVSPICQGETLSALPTTSNNGITGTWSPALDNSATTTYTFTPSTGQCATTTTMTITVNTRVVPAFTAVSPICQGETLSALPTTSNNGISGTWSPALDNSATTTYTFTPNAGQCATTTTMTITVNTRVVPVFTAVSSICQGETLSALPTSSNNGITGTWSPALDNSATTIYTFTPNAGQCATTKTMTITVNTATVPTFTTVSPICQSETLSALPTTSNNGITGSWLPALNNNATTTYTFTPNAGQCATTATMTITVNMGVVPTFTSVTPICQGETLSALPTTSNNGITGTWSPALDNSATTIYTFAPNAGQCATTSTMTITVNMRVVPTFASVTPICQGGTLSALPTTSNNGITGTWSPALNNNATTTYTFTPNAGQCATTATITILVNNATIPTFTPIAPICKGETLSALPTTSNNGIAGSWSPAINDNVSTVYTFEPNAGQCATTVQMTILVNPLPIPVLKDDFLCINNETGTILLPKNLNCGLPNTNHSFSWTLNNNPLPTTTNAHLAFVPGVYEVTATNLLTGCSNTATSIVGTSSLAIAEASVEQDFNRNQVITITVTGGSGVYEFQFDDGTPQESNQFTNIYQGEYEVTIRDKNGCGELVLPVFAMNYPRFFTPNGDGYNDTWSIEGLSEQKDANIYIFDRYGKLITAIKPSQNSSWDGTLNGNKLPSTDYWFTLSYRNRQGINKEFKAHFSLKR